MRRDTMAWRAVIVMLAALPAAAQTVGAAARMPAAAAQNPIPGYVPPVSVPTEAPLHGEPKAFRDDRFGVTFQVPPGWQVSRQDGELSSFHDDAGQRVPAAEVRGVAMLDFNPYPLTTLSGALFYYSVARGVKKRDCMGEALGHDANGAVSVPKPDQQEVSGRRFDHGHDEHGRICIEARDEVYTAYRRGSCYRFDLEVNTFCSVSSGAEDLSDRQIVAVEDRMDAILRSVKLDWGKSPGKSGAAPIQPGTPTPPQLVRPAPVVTRMGAS